MIGWFNKHSLNFKLNVSILACVCLGFFALIYFVSKRVETIIFSQIDHMALKTVNDYAGDFDNLVANAEQIILNTKNTLNQMNKEDISSLRVVLGSVMRTVEYSDLTFTNAWVYEFPLEDVSVGTLYISENIGDDKINFYTREVGNFYSYFPWFKEVPKEEKIYWSEPYMDSVSGGIVITCLIPFKFAGEDDFNGLAAVTVDLSTIQNSINNFSMNEQGRLLLLSRSGLHITHPNPDIALKMTIFELAEKINQPELKIIGENMLAGKSGHIRIVRSEVYDGPVAVFYAPIKKINWGICLVYEQNELLRPVRQFLFVMFIGLLIGMLSLLIIINQVCKRSTRQLLSLSSLAVKYGGGDFSESFKETPSSSDIGFLAQALFNMRTNILNYTEKERQNAAQEQKNRSELEIARKIQESSLSVEYPQHEAFMISTKIIPARKVGGDFYDFFFIDERHFAIVVADVSGKGIPAALYMMKSQTLIRNISKSKVDLGEVFYRVNNELYEGNDTCMFVTVFMSVIDLISGEVQYVNAGHTPFMLLANGEYDFISQKKNVILGVVKGAKFAVEKIKLNSGDHIFLYTDGVTEAENAKSEFYGAKRLKKVLQKATSNPEDNLNLVLKDIKKFVKTNKQSDDITMLEFAYRGYANGEITLAADSKKLRKLIDFLKSDMNRHNVSPEKQFNMISAAEEIFVNIANYAYEKEGSVEVNTFVQDGIYCVRFSDGGKKYNPLKHKDPDTSAELKDRKIGGWGIFLAKKLTDKISYAYEDGRNVLIIGVNL